MQHTLLAAMRSQSRRRRLAGARELSAYDLAAFDLSDEGGWQKGPKGGLFRMVNGKKVYKKGSGAGHQNQRKATTPPGGGGKKAPAPAKRASVEAEDAARQEAEDRKIEATKRGSYLKKLRMAPVAMDELSMRTLPRASGEDWGQAMMGALEAMRHPNVSGSDQAFEDREAINHLSRVMLAGNDHLPQSEMMASLGRVIRQSVVAAQVATRRGDGREKFLSNLARAMFDTGKEYGGSMRSKDQAVQAVYALYRIARYL